MPFEIGDYSVPKTFHKFVPGGVTPRDAHEAQTRLGAIRKHAMGVPGPGEYIKHVNWSKGAEKTFGGTQEAVPDFTIPKTPRDKGIKKNTVPGVGAYEREMKNRHIPLGTTPRGAKVTVFDQSVYFAGLTPSPADYQVKKPQKNCASPMMGHKKSESRKEKEKPTPGPGHFKVSYDLTEKRTPSFSPKKEAKGNFVDRITKLKSTIPAVGTYDAVKLERVARGAAVVQVGLARPKVTGTY